ncbi:MAG: hypothetical protein V4564_04240 [Pseudomonadota bacterium]|uniref:hypothetical protein n=1 Tax=Sphingomonas sp. ERG5 TaxID=1381597 RepID=UPI00054B6A6B|nr:hypothetical protein [Sphingomonas sp. ERG5]
MTTHYNFDYDARRRFLKLTLSGLWDRETLAAFQREAAALLSKVTNAGHADASGRILIDVRDYAVQSQEIADAVSALVPTYGVLAERIAVIWSQSALQKMQMRRLLTSDKLRFMMSEEEALAWLFDAPLAKTG